jgi:hypothetical protein
MSFESLETKPEEEERRPLYPERASAGSEILIDTLKKIEAGELPKIELTENEKKKLFEYENSLGSELQEIYSINSITSKFYPEYFLTPKGKKDFLETVGIEIEGENPEDVQLFLMKNREIIKKMDPAKRRTLSGKTESHSEKRLLGLLLSTLDENGNISIEEMPAPQKIVLLLTPEKSLDKIKKLREFKKKLKDEKNIDDLDSENLKKAREKILELYLRRTNQLITDRFSSAVLVGQLKQSLGADALSSKEKELLASFSGISSSELNYSKFDRFIHGADKTYDERGARIQVSKEILDYANALEQDYIENEINKDEKIKQLGLDPEKIFDANISVEVFSKLAEEILEHYGQKSALPSEEYNPNRAGSAPDEKWQFVVRPEYSSMSVNSKQKIIKSGIKPKTISETFAVLLGHEIEGHFIQNLNRDQIKLKLFEKVGSDRTQIFAEGGAMLVQDEISKHAFGYRTIPHPHYIRAMVKKLEGGNYIECVQAFYESALKKIKAKKERGLSNEAEFKNEILEELELAINRTRRLFRDSEDLGIKSPLLTTSKDTVYLEQSILLEKLKKEGMEKYAFMNGANLKTLITLSEIGLLDLEKIKAPDYYALEIWNRLKSNYVL